MIASRPPSPPNMPPARQVRRARRSRIRRRSRGRRDHVDALHALERLHDAARELVAARLHQEPVHVRGAVLLVLDEHGDECHEHPYFPWAQSLRQPLADRTCEKVRREEGDDPSGEAHHTRATV